MNAHGITAGSVHLAPPLLVVTDLDGTLLDHFSYRFDGAMQALNTLRRLQIPVIPNTSKTAAELQVLRQQLQLDDPFIVENGSAIYLPRSRFPNLRLAEQEQFDCYVLEVGESHSNILSALEALTAQFSFKGFSDMSLEEIVGATGLSEAAAAQARCRQYSEPLIWQDTEAARQKFIAKLEDAGLHTLQGGRFLHVLGKTDKGKATRQLQQYFETVYGKCIPVLALGDSQNDIAMLETAEFPVIVRSPVHDLPQLRTDRLIRVSQQCGPVGWGECVLQILEQENITKGAIGNG